MDKVDPDVGKVLFNPLCLLSSCTDHLTQMLLMPRFLWINCQGGNTFTSYQLYLGLLSLCAVSDA